MNILDKDYSYGEFNKNYKPFKIREIDFDNHLKKNKRHILRLYGVGLTKKFNIKGEISETFNIVMKDTLKDLVDNIKCCYKGYTFFDEISLFINFKLGNFHNRRIQKILLIIASKTTVTFYKYALKLNLDNLDYNISFDCKIIEMQDDYTSDIINYLKSRQAFAIDRFFSKLKRNIV